MEIREWRHSRYATLLRGSEWMEISPPRPPSPYSTPQLRRRLQVDLSWFESWFSNRDRGCPPPHVWRVLVSHSSILSFGFEGGNFYPDSKAAARIIFCFFLSFSRWKFTDQWRRLVGWNFGGAKGGSDGGVGSFPYLREVPRKKFEN